jgi:CxxC motif-containing protein (DUF1111 family)
MLKRLIRHTIIALCLLYVGFGEKLSAQDLPDITEQGGAMTSDLSGRHVLQLPAPNISSEEMRLLQLSGFSAFHKLFSKTEGLGPNFVNNSCGGCHIENGRGDNDLTGNDNGHSTMIIKVGLKNRTTSDGTSRPLPSIGAQLQSHTTGGKQLYKTKLAWRTSSGRYRDGTRYTLRKPEVTFSIPGISSRTIAYSLRTTPAIIGPGLLEAVPDSVIGERSDPSDRDGDGISGKIPYVRDVVTQNLSIGRFGFKSTHPTLAQQIGAAFVLDMGLTNPLFPAADSAKTTEISASEFTKIQVYQQLAGVPRARNQSDAAVIAGKKLFVSIGCESCHRMTLTTGTTSSPEVSNQEIHPFTDLLLHDMGSGLADSYREFSASGREWRTTPLWGLGFSSTISSVRPTYLHDGRAKTIAEAIIWHGGEGRRAQEAFLRLKKSEREQLLQFLKSL